MKLTEQHTAFLSPVSLEVEKAFLSYRLGMRVTEVRGSIPLCTEKQDTTSVLDAKPLWNGNSYPLRQMRAASWLGRLLTSESHLSWEKKNEAWFYLHTSEGIHVFTETVAYCSFAKVASKYRVLCMKVSDISINESFVTVLEQRCPLWKLDPIHLLDVIDDSAVTRFQAKVRAWNKPCPHLTLFMYLFDAYDKASLWIVCLQDELLNGEFPKEEWQYFYQRMAAVCALYILPAKSWLM